MDSLIYISAAILAGLLMSRVAKKLQLPAVTAYLVAGIIIGPFCLGALNIPLLGFNTLDQVKSFGLISNAALGFIAFTIGDEFRLSQLKQTGKTVFIIGVIQAVIAAVLVDVVLITLHFTVLGDKLPLPAAITLGAIAAATAPAATLMVVKQYKAKGKLTDVLLSVVALDDAVGLIVFAVSFGISKALISGTVDIVSIIVNPLIEIFASLLLGLVAGLIFTFLERFFHSNSKRMSMSIAFVFLTVAISMIKINIGPVTVGFSVLLVCMMMGTVFCNMCEFSEEIMAKTDRWTAPLFVVFFVLSGAELDFSVFADIAIIGIGVIYIITRALGKYYGTVLGAKISGAEENIKKYLGIALLPQAGVALGMSVSAEAALGSEGLLIRNIVLFAVLIYELLGPTFTKIALTKAGEITPEGKTTARIKNK